MSSKQIILYLHAHQPFRLRPYTIFEAGVAGNYFDTPHDDPNGNWQVLQKVAVKSYQPTNQLFLKLLDEHPEFKLNLSITGTLIEQLEMWSPETLQSFIQLAKSGRVEIAAETYHHSLAFFYSRPEFESQVNKHRQKIQDVFGQTPVVFRNTELAYNNELAAWAEQAGYRGILAEGWDPVLGWRSPNFMYRPIGTQNIKLLLKNYRLSDDIAFRFGDKDWEGWPLTADKFSHWLSETHEAQIFNLFMDYETFGEHQWSDKGIFEFLEHLPRRWKEAGGGFMNFSEALDSYEPADDIDMPYTITWADTERDLTAWLGNPMQTQAASSLYEFSQAIANCHDQQLVEDWRRLQTSDHFYYMCTKWFTDGDVHAYFSPYESPYDAYLNFMNIFQDLRFRLAQKGLL